MHARPTARPPVTTNRPTKQNSPIVRSRESNSFSSVARPRARAFGDTVVHLRSRDSAASGPARPRSRRTSAKQATPSSVAGVVLVYTRAPILRNSCTRVRFATRSARYTTRDVASSGPSMLRSRARAHTQASNRITYYSSRSRHRARSRATLPSVTERLSGVMAALPRRRARHRHASEDTVSGILLRAAALPFTSVSLVPCATRFPYLSPRSLPTNLLSVPRSSAVQLPLSLFCNSRAGRSGTEELFVASRRCRRASSPTLEHRLLPPLAP